MKVVMKAIEQKATTQSDLLDYFPPPNWGFPITRWTASTSRATLPTGNDLYAMFYGFHYFCGIIYIWIEIIQLGQAIPGAFFSKEN